jgi:RNA polymerase sigma factor (TIGR02999 family)
MTARRIGLTCALIVRQHLRTLKAKGPGVSGSDVTQLLIEWSRGNQSVLDELFPIVYDELRRLARNYLRQERSDHTLQPTALVHEAYLRLIDQRSVSWQNRAQFFGLAAQMMRRILVNHAVGRHAVKRGGHVRRIPLDEAIEELEARQVDVIALDAALTALHALDARQSQIVELRFFGGLTVNETAEVVGTSPATVKRDWTTAKLWLLRELDRK